MKSAKQFSLRALALMLVMALAGWPVMVYTGAQIQSVRDAQTAFVKEVTFLAVANRTANGDSGAPIDVSAYSGGVILVTVTAVGGSPSMTPTVEICEDSGTSNCAYVHTAGSAQTTVSKQVIKVNNFGRFVRISFLCSAGGVTFGVKGVFKPTT